MLILLKHKDSLLSVIVSYFHLKWTFATDFYSIIIKPFDHWPPPQKKWGSGGHPTLLFLRLKNVPWFEQSSPWHGSKLGRACFFFLPVHGSTKIAVVWDKALRVFRRASDLQIFTKHTESFVPDHGELCSGPRRSLLNHGRAEKTVLPSFVQTTAQGALFKPRNNL